MDSEPTTKDAVVLYSISSAQLLDERAIHSSSNCGKCGGIAGNSKCRLIGSIRASI